MDNELKKINELYDVILSKKKIIHEQISPGSSNMFGETKVVFDKTSEGAVPPNGWKPGYKFIIQTSTDVFSPIEGTVEQSSTSNGRYYVYLSANGNQVYIGNLNSSELSRGSKVNVGDKIGSVNSGSFVYVASNPQSITSLIDNSGNITGVSNNQADTNKEFDMFSDNNKGVNLTAKVFGDVLSKQMESTEQKAKKLLYEIKVKVSDVENSYPNIKFHERTKNDEINKPLLDDINDAAESIDAVVTVDFAKTDHRMRTKRGTISRHHLESAVDIDFIYLGDKKYVVSPENIDVVEKFTNALLSMGYKKNRESEDHPKAFLTFGAEDHDDHVHVSNLTDVSSGMPLGIPIPGLPDVDLGNDNFEEILDKTVFKGMDVAEKAEAIKKIKEAGLWVTGAVSAVGLVSLLTKIGGVLKSGFKNITDDSSYGGKQQQVNRTAEYVGNLIQAILPF